MASHPSRATGPPYRILVVEDEWLVAQDIAQAVREAGHVPIGPVSASADAFDVLSREAVEIALIDVNLAQGETTEELAEALAERGIPFAAVTGVDRAALPASVGRGGYLRKPVTEHELRRLLAGLCAALDLARGDRARGAEAGGE